jgi:hypothetical protein
MYSMRFILNTLFYFLCLSSAVGQNLTSHPLSNIGIGEIGQNSHSIYDCLGRGYDAYYDSSQLNYFNPSSYSSLSTGNTLLSLGINARISNYKQGQESAVMPIAMVDHFVLGFKIMKRMGLAFGLTPFSKKGYEISERVYTGVDSLKYIYSGNGTVNKLFAGYSYSLINSKKVKLTTGFNIAYLFGTLNNDRMSLLIDNNSLSGGLSRTSLGVKAFHYNLGMTYKHIINKNYHLIIGGTVEPAQRFNTTFNSAFYTSNTIFNPSSYDTLSINSSKGQLSSKTNYSIGMTHKFILGALKRKNKTLHPNLIVTTSYSLKNSLASNLDSSFINTYKGTHIGFGIQYSPETNPYENSTSLKFLDKLTYRIGGFYDKMPYFQNGKQFIDRGISLGFGIPILVQQSLSSINISVSAGQRSNFVSNSLNENYLGISFGIILSPANFERWFRKRKLD